MFVSLLLILMKVQSSDADLKRNLRYLSETHFEFAIDLYHEVVKSRSGNLVISAHNVTRGAGDALPWNHCQHNKLPTTQELLSLDMELETS